MQVIGLLPAMWVMGIPLLPARASRAEQGWLAVLSLATFGSAYSYFSACTMLPLGDATSLIGLYPVTTALGGRLWLDEMLGWRGSAAACLAAAGGVLVARPPGLSGGSHAEPVFDPAASAQRSLGLLLAGSSCLLTTSQYLILRRLGSCAHPTQTMLLFLALAGPTALALHLSIETTIYPSARGALELVAMGLVALVAQVRIVPLASLRPTGSRTSDSQLCGNRVSAFQKADVLSRTKDHSASCHLSAWRTTGTVVSCPPQGWA